MPAMSVSPNSTLRVVRNVAGMRPSSAGASSRPLAPLSPASGERGEEPAPPRELLRRVELETDQVGIVAQIKTAIAQRRVGPGRLADLVGACQLLVFLGIRIEQYQVAEVLEHQQLVVGGAQQAGVKGAD